MKNKKIPENRIRTTITFGYSLFIINLIAAIIGSISFSAILSEPSINHFNVDIFLPFVIFSGVLPTLVSYIIGDRTAHAKNIKIHHYNGVLFGLVAYWLAMLFNNIGSAIQTPNIENTPFILTQIINAWPILATITIMAFVAIIYNRKPKNNNTMLQYLPYQIVLFSAITGTFVFTILNQYCTTLNLNYLLSLIITILIVIILVAISYKAMPMNNSSALTHTAQSIVAVTIGLICIALISQLMYQVSIDIATPASCICGLTVWIIYLRLMSRKS